MGRGKVMEVKFYDTVNDELLKFKLSPLSRTF